MGLVQVLVTAVTHKKNQNVLARLPYEYRTVVRVRYLGRKRTVAHCFVQSQTDRQIQTEWPVDLRQRLTAELVHITNGLLIVTASEQWLVTVKTRQLIEFDFLSIVHCSDTAISKWLECVVQSLCGLQNQRLQGKSGLVQTGRWTILSPYDYD